MEVFFSKVKEFSEISLQSKIYSIVRNPTFHSQVQLKVSELYEVSEFLLIFTIKRSYGEVREFSEQKL